MSYYSVSDFYKSIFGSKVYKLSIDAGCTCPVRDGTLGTGGCIFCSQNGSGDFVPSKQLSITEQLEEAKKLVNSKMPLKESQDGLIKKDEKKYIAYFQNFTNTYGDLNLLKKKWEEALSCQGIVGIAIGTRPDCLSDECLKILGELAEKTFVQIELGFQTSNEKTVEYIRRHFENIVYKEAVQALHKANKKIHVVTHVIFGLPGESKNDMLQTVQYALNAGTDGIKIMNLYILKNTDLADDFVKGNFKALEFSEYLDLLKSVLEIIPENIVVHRLTGDPPKNILIAPLWVTDKKRVLNELKKLK